MTSRGGLGLAGERIGQVGEGNLTSSGGIGLVGEG